jgi:RimJ/RimL family protein N-acetyltransferase
VAEDDEPTTWEIRRAEVGDVAAIAALIREVAPASFESSGTGEQISAWVAHHANEARIARRVGDPAIVTLIVEHDGQVAGTGFVAFTDKTPRSAYLGGIYCRVRGQGAGTRIVNSLLDHVAGHGAARASMDVGINNTQMMSLAVKLGFREQHRYWDQDFFPNGEFISLRM